MDQLNSCRVWTALVTPFDQQGKIHYEDLKKLLHKQEEAGNGILIIGSTGEGLSLTEEEKKQVVHFVCAQQLKVPLMVGVGGFDLEQNLRWLDYCSQYPIDAYLMVTPLYAKPGPIGQKTWFKHLLDHSTKPCMLYNVPSRTGVSLSLKAVKELEHHPRLWAIKEASGSISEFENYKIELPQLKLYSGEDGLISYQALMGAHGVVSVATNLWPKEFSLYVKKALEQKTNVCDILLWKKAIEFCFCVSNPIPAKVGLFLKKWISSPQLRLPLIDLELEEKKRNEFLQLNTQIENSCKK